MSNNRRKAFVVGTLAALLGLLVQAEARVVPEATVESREYSALVVLQQQQQPGPVSLEEAQRRALQRFKGRVAGAKTVDEDGRKVHEVRIIGEDNHVRTFRINAQTGAFL